VSEKLSNGPRASAGSTARAGAPRQPMRGFLIDEDES
jgi:hypothetical protein